ncbi:hypothetical protein KC351_g6418 [Hortaea werneckii]|nr:hypothetical protein KC351_g6418 [Hortaea werneckii]
MAPGTKRRSIRQAATRKRSIYFEPDTDDDWDYEAHAEEEFQPDPGPSNPPAHKRRKSAPRTRHITRSKSERERRSSKPRKVVGSKRKANHLSEPPKKAFSGPSDGKVPDWTSLPVEILRDIFVYASQPLHEQTQASAANVTWLMKTARICRAFAVPALEAYYLSPAILTQVEPFYLLDLMRKPKEKRWMDYNVKVKELEVDVRRLAYAAHNRGLFDLSTLVAELPQLQHLEVLHPADEPPFRPMKIANWHYPAALFELMDQKAHRVKSFRWNRDMIRIASPEDLYTFMAQIHSSKPFEYLQDLTVCAFDYHDSAEPTPPSTEEEAMNPSAATAPGLATSISLLPSLKSLTFITCDIIMDTFLIRMPSNLESLTLTNCLEVTSEMLRSYLATHGTHLRQLVLNHNTSLNLEFLPTLKQTAPRLETLKMDLRYFSERVNSYDADPLYDQLLSTSSIPTWPRSLRYLELEHMQKFPPEAAENLFSSLVESAQELPDLRHLVLAAHINIPWRDRAGFRDRWIGRLLRVYQRRDEPPNRYLGSFRQYRLYKKAKAAGRGTPPPDAPDGSDAEEDGLGGGRRKMTHIEVSPAKPHDGDTDVYSDSSPDSKPRPQQRRSARVASVASQRSATPAEQPTSPDSGTENDDERGAEEEAEFHVQGLCNVVDVRIDNQRPRENQFTEGDFLDAEASGDEDWHEGADMEWEDEGRHAW